jgi:MerR family transcriptional regulator, thiopeptide resistance regulator
MMTATKLGRRCGLSRSTVLYYESLGLLRRPARTEGNYRAYTDQDLLRLQQITTYRKVGLALSAVREVLGQPRGRAAAVLEQRLVEIDAEIETLRSHQQAIVRLLRHSRAFRRSDMITKEKWVSIMQAAGFSAADRERWHTEFERSAPAEHQEFLEFLHIPPDEIKLIREHSRAGKHA